MTVTTILQGWRRVFVTGNLGQHVLHPTLQTGREPAANSEENQQEQGPKSPKARNSGLYTLNPKPKNPRPLEKPYTLSPQPSSIGKPATLDRRGPPKP